MNLLKQLEKKKKNCRLSVANEVEILQMVANYNLGVDGGVITGIKSPIAFILPSHFLYEGWLDILIGRNNPGV